MQPIERCLEHADELSQEVVNAWAINVRRGASGALTGEFRALFEKACGYREAKKLADNRREAGILTEQDAAEETAARLTFAKAYNPFFEKHHMAI